MNDAVGVHCEFEISEAPEVVRASLMDPSALVSCVPGATLSMTDGNALRGRIKLKMSAVPEQYAVKARLTEPRGPAGPIRLAGRAQDDRTGHGVDFTMEISVDEAGGGLTRAVLSGEVRQSLGTRPAGSRVSAQAMVDRLAPQFARRLEEVAGGRLGVSGPSHTSADEDEPTQESPHSTVQWSRRTDEVLAKGVAAARIAGDQVRRGSAKLLRSYLAMTSRPRPRSGRRQDT